MFLWISDLINLQPAVPGADPVGRGGGGHLGAQPLPSAGSRDFFETSVIRERALCLDKDLPVDKFAPRNPHKTLISVFSEG